MERQLSKPTDVDLDSTGSEPEGSGCCRVLPGLDVVEQVLPAVVDVLQLVVDLRLFGLVAGSDELLTQLLQVGLVLAEQVDLFHAVLSDEASESKHSQ